MPGVTIIIPTFNRTRYLEEALTSALEQTHSVSEVILVDDGSSDHYRPQIRALCELDPRIKLVENQENEGISRTRNIGVSHASGEYIAFLDDDDILDSMFVEKSLDTLLKRQLVGAVYSDTEIMPFPKSNRRAKRVKCLITRRRQFDFGQKQNAASEILFFTPMINSFLFRREVLLNHPFPEDLCYGEDIYLWLEMIGKGVQFKRIKEVTSFVRIHEENRSAIVEANEAMRFFDKVRDNELLKQPDSVQLNAMREMHFRLTRGMMPSLRLIWSAMHRPLRAIRYLRLLIGVYFCALR